MKGRNDVELTADITLIRKPKISPIRNVNTLIARAIEHHLSCARSRFRSDASNATVHQLKILQVIVAWQ